MQSTTYLKSAIALSVSLALSKGQAQTFEYTQSENSQTKIALGYPVPMPIDSLTPVDGFRSYDALMLRLQQLDEQSDALTRVQVGLTTEMREIWAFQMSDADDVRRTGGTEHSALINGGIHAREWQSPEATAYTIEKLTASQEDQHLHQYLIENLNFVVIPVLNVDGFLQTQRYPNMVTDSQTIPRDGRMRRKNMNGVDSDLSTANDNLLGVDLNRNNNPFWATSSSSSDDGTELIYHGVGPASEPEIQALQNAAVLAGEEDLAFYIDTHSFTQLYFLHNIGVTSTDNETARLSTAMRAANNFRYAASPETAGVGIGTTGEYFAETYQIPSFTLEIEPTRNGGLQYGGNGVSHDGFILPASEVARMRNEVSSANYSGLYSIADTPFLQSVTIASIDGEIAYQSAWAVTDTGRELQVTVNNALQAGQTYEITLVFNKPMRALDDGGNVDNFANLSSENGVNLQWQVVDNGTVSEVDVDTSTGEWQVEQGSFSHYKTDTYRVQVTLDADAQWSDLSGLTLVVNVTDMTGTRLDIDPSTITQWRNGGYQGYEGDSSLDGSVDNNTVLIEPPEDTSPTTPTTPTTPSTPTTPTTPTTPDSGSSGGGSLGGLLFLGLGLVSRRTTKKGT